MARLPQIAQRVFPTDALRVTTPAADARFRWFQALTPKVFAIPHKVSLLNLVDRKDLTIFSTGATTTVGKGLGNGATINNNQAWYLSGMPASGSQPRQTFGWVGSISSFAAASAVHTTGDGDGAGIVTAVYVTATGGVEFWRFGFAIDALTGLTLALNVPYFLIISHNAPGNTITAWLKNLNTEQITSVTVASGQQGTDAGFYNHGSRHITGLNGEMRGTSYLAAYLRGAISDTHARQWMRDPFGPYRAPETRNMVAAAAGGANLFTFVGSGGMQSGGAALVLTQRVVLGVGGAQTGGAATIRHVKTITGVGGAQTGGAATISHRKTVTGVGGAQAGGAALVRTVHVFLGSGGAQSGGAATTSITHVFPYVGVGGAQTGGAATFSHRKTVIGVGGGQSGGSAGVQFQGTQVYVGSGGAQSGGAALVSHRKVAPIGTGGAQSGGAATIVRIRHVVGVGGLTSAGAAIVRHVKSVVGVGGLQSGGAGVVQYIFGGTIPSTLKGNVIAYPSMTGRLSVITRLIGRVSSTPL